MKFYSLFAVSLISLLTACQSGQKSSGSSAAFKEALKSWESDKKGSFLAFQSACVGGHQGACTFVGQKFKKPTGLAIIQGIGSEAHAELRILRPKSSKLSYYVVANQYQSGPVRTQKTKRVEPLSSREILGHKSSMDYLEIPNLEQGLLYQFVTLNQDGQIIDFRSFRLLDRRSPRPRMAVVSCLDETNPDQKQIWDELKLKDPQIILMIGDNVYADKGPGFSGDATPEQLWKRHLQVREKLQIFRQQNLTPILALWDDHDLGMNDGGKAYQHLELSRDIFKVFFPLEKTGILERGPGLSSKIIFGGAPFLLLDGRSFRARPDLADKTGGDHLGEELVQWTLSELKETGRPGFLVKGDQFFGGYHPFESFEKSHPTKFDEFKKALKGIRQKVLFVSGDRHLTEVLKIPPKEVGYSTYELTSSGLHAKVFPDAFERNKSPYFHKGKAGVLNYLILKPKLIGRRLYVSYESFGLNSVSLFKDRFYIR